MTNPVSDQRICAHSPYTQETAELVDGRFGLHLQLPSKAFWNGFEDMNCEFCQ